MPGGLSFTSEPFSLGGHAFTRSIQGVGRGIAAPPTLPPRAYLGGACHLNISAILSLYWQ